jgi:rubrerythrin
MVTLVGTQSDFAGALKSLVELEYDALSAYESAFEGFDSKIYKTKVQEFSRDHERHIEELSKILNDRGEDAPTQHDVIKHLLVKGKVVLANMLGDEAILSAMLSNEGDTNQAYSTILRHDMKWPEAMPILERAYADEKRHKEWFRQASSELPSLSLD